MFIINNKLKNMYSIYDFVMINIIHFTLMTALHDIVLETHNAMKVDEHYNILNYVIIASTIVYSVISYSIMLCIDTGATICIITLFTGMNHINISNNPMLVIYLILISFRLGLYAKNELYKDFICPY